MNEILPLVFPAPNGIGMLDKAVYDQTVKISKDAAIIPSDPSPDATRTDLATKALSAITDMDTKGASFQKGTVEVTEGGK